MAVFNLNCSISKEGSFPLDVSEVFYYNETILTATEKEKTDKEKKEISFQKQLNSKRTQLYKSQIVSYIFSEDSSEKIVHYVITNSNSANNNDVEYDFLIRDDTVVLSENLYNYTTYRIGNISAGNAQNGTEICQRGSNLREVFNKLFGEMKNKEPTITGSISFTGNYSRNQYYNSGDELGTSVTKTDHTVTFTLSNEKECEYGYIVKDGSNKEYKIFDKNGKFDFYYPIDNYTINGKSANLKITLPTKIKTEYNASSALNQLDIYLTDDTSENATETVIKINTTRIKFYIFYK